MKKITKTLTSITEKEVISYEGTYTLDFWQHSYFTRTVITIFQLTIRITVTKVVYFSRVFVHSCENHKHKYIYPNEIGEYWKNQGNWNFTIGLEVSQFRERW